MTSFLRRRKRPLKGIAILCSGPSLDTHLTPGSYLRTYGYDIYLGLNMAVTLFPCHWWVSAAVTTPKYFQPLGHPTLYTQRTYLYTELNPAVFRYTWVSRNMMPHKIKPHGRFSSLLALELAMNLSLELEKDLDETLPIDVYGMDLKGENYANGYELPENWKPLGYNWSRRWREEISDLAIAFPQVRSKGISLARLAPADPTGSARPGELSDPGSH